MNVFDKTKKAVVTVKDAVTTISATKPPEVVKKKPHVLNWMAIDVVDGEYIIRIQRIVDGVLEVSRKIPALDVNDAELMFEQYAAKYVYDRQELKDG